MKRVYSSPNNLLVHHMRNLLETAGIDCQVRNELLMGGAGDLPVLDVWPELWVDDDLYTRAQELLDTHSTASGEHWTCARCGTDCEGQFDRCWQCGTVRAP